MRGARAKMLRRYAKAALIRVGKSGKDAVPAKMEGQTFIQGGDTRAYRNAKALWRGHRFAV